MKSPGKLAAGAARRLLTPLVPRRSLLPYTFWLHKLGGGAEPELLHLDEFIAATGTAIDVGANVGFYTYALSRRFKHVYAFEINDGITGPIAHYNPGNIELIHCGLSSSEGRARFYIPVSGGIAQAGWASLYRDNLPGAEKLIERDVRVAPLDDFKISGVDFIKIDVEGHEIEVLKGAAATIEASRPNVLIELKKEHVETVNEWFRNLDYKHCRLEDFNDVPGHRSNHIYVPLERLAHFGIARPTD
jgi:FkbM family methyltransferase